MEATQETKTIKTNQFPDKTGSNEDFTHKEIPESKQHTSEVSISSRHISQTENNKCIFICKILVTIPLFIIGTGFCAVYGLFCGLATIPCSCYMLASACSPEAACAIPVLCWAIPCIMTVCWTADGLFSGGYLFCSKLWNDRDIFIPSGITCLPPLLNTPLVMCCGDIYYMR